MSPALHAWVSLSLGVTLATAPPAEVAWSEDGASEAAALERRSRGLIYIPDAAEAAPPLDSPPEVPEARFLLDPAALEYNFKRERLNRRARRQLIAGGVLTLTVVLLIVGVPLIIAGAHKRRFPERYIGRRPVRASICPGAFVLEF